MHRGLVHGALRRDQRFNEQVALAHDRERVVRVQEPVAEDRLREVVDTLGREGVGGPFGDHDRDHVRHDVSECAGKLEHDDAEGERHARDGEEGSADHGEDAGGDGRDELAEEAAEERASVKRGDDNVRGDFAAGSDDSEE